MTFREWLKSEVDGWIRRIATEALRDALAQSDLANEQDVLVMALDLTQLTNEVSANTDAVSSASSLLSTLSQEIRDAAADPAALAALADKLDANNQALAAAVTANTPAASEPATPPAETPPAESTPADTGTPTDTGNVDPNADPNAPVQS